MTLEIGTILHERYRIDAVLSKGGMGAIYHAIDERLGVSAAVKENLFSTEEASRQFRREATILAGLRHPNLPRVTDHFVFPGQGQYLVMDYIEGEDLRERMNRQGTLPEEEAILIGVAICDALTYLHTRPNPVFHRDIKPGNIKITPSGQIFLVDFGLAKVSQPGQATTVGAQALTPGYAPPEQYGQGTDARSDIYALGATLYAALAGRVPEDGLSRMMGSVELTPLRQTNPSISERGSSAIQKAMSVNMDERFQTAELFKQALLEANKNAKRKTATGEIRIQPPTVKVDAAAMVVKPAGQALDTGDQKQVSKPQKKQKKSSIPVALIVIGIILVLGICLVLGIIIANQAGLMPTAISKNQASTPTLAAPSATTAVLSTDTPAPSPTKTEDTPTPEEVLPSPTIPPTDTPEATFTPAPASTPFGGGYGKIAFTSNQAGKPQIWVMNSDGSGLTQITKLADGACQPDWSPDGNHLVIVSPCRIRQEAYPGSALFIINSNGSGLKPLVSVPGGDFDPAWSPDGKKIAFTSLRLNNVPYIFIYDFETNKASRLMNTATNEMRPAWSPDGQTLAFESTRLGLNQIWTVGADGKGTKEFTTQDLGPAHFAAWNPKGDFITFSAGNNPVALFSKSFPASGTQVYSVSDFRPAVSANYSPDGIWLAFESMQNGNRDIYRMTALGGADRERLTTDSSDDFDPDWQPGNP